MRTIHKPLGINMFGKPSKISHWLAKRQISKPQFEPEFVFPYSSNFDERKNQIIENLQSGLLLEDRATVIPWLYPQGLIDKFAEKINFRGDRTVFYLGNREIFSGLKVHLEVLCWVGNYSRPLARISSNLGQDQTGFTRMKEFESHLTSILGEPHVKQMDPYWNNKAGTISWQFGKVEVSIVGFDMHALRYTFDVSLIDDPNVKLDKIAIEEIKTKYGLTEEDLGK